MITVTYTKRNKKPIKTEICWQWDYNQVLKIEEIPFQIIPEVHFWQEGMDKALVVKGECDKERNYHSVSAMIPNKLLEIDEPITAYLYDETPGNYGETLGVYQIPVTTREQPEDYEYFENVTTTLSGKFEEYDQKFAAMQDLLDFMSEGDSTLKARIDALEVTSGQIPEDLQTKLEALDKIEVGAQVNKIEKIKVGETEVEGVEKVADITDVAKAVIATETADLALKVVAVETKEELPAEGAAQTVYLVKNGGAGDNAHDEYIWTGSAYELFGTTEIDLSDYVKTGALTEAIAGVEAKVEAVKTTADGAVQRDAGLSAMTIGHDENGFFVEYTEVVTPTPDPEEPVA